MFITWENLVEFFLDDFSQAGKESGSGYDLRGYLFSELNATMLISNEERSLEFNFENFVRLFVNAVNQTIELDVEVFKENTNEK